MAKKKKKKGVLQRALAFVNNQSQEAHKRMMKPTATPYQGGGRGPIQAKKAAPVIQRPTGPHAGFAPRASVASIQADRRRAQAQYERRMSRKPKTKAERLYRTAILNGLERNAGELMTAVGKKSFAKLLPFSDNTLVSMVDRAYPLTGDWLATLGSEAKFYLGRNKVPKMTSSFKKRMPGMSDNANVHERYIEDTRKGGIQKYVWDMLHSGKDPTRVLRELDRIGHPEFKDDIAYSYPSKIGQSLLNDYNKKMATNLKGAGKAEQYLNLGVGEIAHMAPTMLAGGMAGAAAKTGASAAQAAKSAALAARTASAGLAGAGAYGSAYNRAYNEGGGENASRFYAGASALSEAGLGMALGKIPGMGNPLIPLEKVVAKKLPAKGAAAYLARKGINAVGEGIEEGAQEVLDPFLQRATYNPDADGPKFGDVAESALMGAAIGGVLGSGHRVEAEAPSLKEARNRLKAELTRPKSKKMTAQPMVDPTINPLLNATGGQGGNPLINHAQNPLVAKVTENPNMPIAPTAAVKPARSMSPIGGPMNIQPPIATGVPTSAPVTESVPPIEAAPPIESAPPIEAAPMPRAEFTPMARKALMKLPLQKEAMPNAPVTPPVNPFNPGLAAQHSLAVDDSMLFDRPRMIAPEQVTQGAEQTADTNFIAPGMRNFLNDVSKRSGLDIRISKGMGNAKGVLQGKTIYLSEDLFGTNPELAVTGILTHEITHAMEQTPQYTRLADLAAKAMSADYGGMDFNGMINRKMQEYQAGGIALDENGARGEIVAEFMEKAMNDPVTAQRLLTQEPSAFMRALQWIKDALETLLNNISLRSDKVAQTQYNCYRKAQKVFVQALNNNLQGRGAGQFAIDYVPVKTEDGAKVMPLVDVDGDIYKHASVNETSGYVDASFPRLRKGVKRDTKDAFSANKTYTDFTGREIGLHYPGEKKAQYEMLYGKTVTGNSRAGHKGGADYNTAILESVNNISDVISLIVPTEKTPSKDGKHEKMAAHGWENGTFILRERPTGKTFLIQTQVAEDENGRLTLYNLKNVRSFDLTNDTLTKDELSRMAISGQEKRTQVSKIESNPLEGGTHRPNLSPFIDPTLPSNEADVNPANPLESVGATDEAQAAISPHLETPVERSARLGREMGLKERGVHALSLDPFGRERLGAYDKYGKTVKGFADTSHPIGQLADVGTKLYARFVDDADPLVRLAKALPDDIKNQPGNRVMIEERLQQVRQAGGTIDYIAEKGLLNADGEIIGESWAELDKLVPKNLRGEFNAYRQALHQMDRIREGKDVTSDTWERAYWKVQNIEAAHPEFRDIVDRQVKWWQDFMQAWAVDTGLMSQENFDTLKTLYPHYYPTYRTKYKNRGSGVSRNDSGAFKKAKGSHEEVGDFSDNIMRKVSEIVVAERKNELSGDIVKALELGDFDMRGWGQITRTGKDTLEQARVEDGFDLFPESTDAGKEETEKGRNTFVYRENGLPIEFTVNDNLAYALKSLRGKDFGELKYPLSLMRKGTGAMKMLTTGVNPFFGLNNGIRDVQVGFVHSKANAKYSKEYAQAMASIMQKGDMWNEYRQMGGAASGFFNDTQDMIRANSVHKGKIAKTMSAVGAFNEVIEQTPRLLEYTRVRNEALEQGYSLKEAKIKASLAGASATVNFSRSGTFTKGLDSYVPYLNAAVQGIDWAIREMKNNPAGVVAKGILIPMGVELLLSAAIGDDDNPWYEEIVDEDKDKFFVFGNPYGEKDENGNNMSFIKVPRNREWGAFMAAGWRLRDLMHKGQLKDPDALKSGAFEILKRTYEENKIPNLLKGILAPISETHENKGFAGQEIVPKYLQDLPNEKQYDSETGEVAKWLGKLFGLSPMKLDYMANSWLGVAEDVGNPLSSALIKGAKGEGKNKVMDLVKKGTLGPFARKFTLDPLYRSKTQKEYYDRLDDLNKKVAVEKADLRAEGRKIGEDWKTPTMEERQMINSQQKKIRELRKKERDLDNSSLSAKEVKKQKSALRRERIELMKLGMTSANITREVAKKEFKVNADLSYLKGNRSYETAKILKGMGYSAAEQKQLKAELKAYKASKPKAHKDPVTKDNVMEENYAKDIVFLSMVKKQGGDINKTLSLASQVNETRGVLGKNGRSINGTTVPNQFAVIDNSDVPDGIKTLLKYRVVKNENSRQKRGLAPTYRKQLLDAGYSEEELSAMPSLGR